MTKKTRQDERKTEKLARVWRKVLTFATDFENEIKKNMITISNVGTGFVPAHKNAEK